jgi:hypothetical protein
VTGSRDGALGIDRRRLRRFVTRELVPGSLLGKSARFVLAKAIVVSAERAGCHRIYDSERRRSFG